ncbi:unnamed protein product [Rangifer tarandus platyrhynchus]|uniref:Uncharacterized protein n=2 Tax=Rangifer tarandus platyrhynchus TaxID=3082113 RepID=A0ACB0DWN8_RANTA|nr:unnamed protein product [Rangifer tarandus platyrhynchus]CAI9692708.1 unnamed protein product [Rangifer tarandus platyrhynchus]
MFFLLTSLNVMTAWKWGVAGRKRTEDGSTHVRPGDCAPEGTGWGAAPCPASGHRRFLREENDNPAASRNDKADLKATRFYVIDLGSKGLVGWR